MLGADWKTGIYVQDPDGKHFCTAYHDACWQPGYNVEGKKLSWAHRWALRILGFHDPECGLGSLDNASHEETWKLQDGTGRTCSFCWMNNLSKKKPMEQPSQAKIEYLRSLFK